MADAFFEEEGSRLLTPHAFEFVLDGEMKRAVRSQNYLTLVALETRREWDGMTVTADDGTLDEVARIEREVIKKALERTGGNKAAAAQVLNLKRTTLVEKLKRLDGFA